MPLGRGSGFGQFFRFSSALWEFTGSQAYTGKVFLLLMRQRNFAGLQEGLHAPFPSTSIRITC